MKTIVTFGTFDLLHRGHLNILKYCTTLSEQVIVGVSSDAFSHVKKSRYPVYNEDDRMFIVGNVKGVSGVFLEDSMQKKRDYIIKYKADTLVMGSDWTGYFDEFSDICEVVYYPRTKDISTTSTVEKIMKIKQTDNLCIHSDHCQ
jgi:glycerol-3-phosphate cytidylyltransferase